MKRSKATSVDIHFLTLFLSLASLFVISSKRNHVCLLCSRSTLLSISRDLCSITPLFAAAEAAWAAHEMKDTWHAAATLHHDPVNRHPTSRLSLFTQHFQQLNTQEKWGEMC